MLITLIGTGVGVFITVRTPPTYASTVTFFVKTPTSSTDSALSGDQFGQKRVNTYVQMMSSDRLAAEVASCRAGGPHARAGGQPDLRPG